ncbi:hypothetical protein [Quatrionicoccus australiensis]|uniref:hypothetical protein n=1 Tax=Quatrionicoccus australiensis TaxID=138118 RepID=UPI001CFC14A3|nr:hypothetical protein [Quatrionicoccus australiensis]MCB4358421.1 hypothetical protein [Quatrionicoccus australiensis]
MCDAVSPIFYAAMAALAAGGSYMQSEAANDAADRQAAALNSAMEQQDNWAKKAEAKAMENAQEYDMTDRTDRLNAAREQAGNSLVDSLVKSREQLGAGEQATGKLSDAFITDQQGKMANQFQRSVDMARLMGKMRGVQDMLGQEGIKNADYANQLGIIGRNAKGALDAAQPGIIAAGKIDSGKAALGSFMSSVGSSGLGSGFGGSLGSAASNTNLMR